ncbi:MAG: hypothetical protein H6624_14770 [Bdellovibrionaceae bacterium]|nr:hypothetical protein [Bdellovibrionales bacterium]MCB9085607.1 hypothetical protein [Pseudobdellovibrionaceae bacterium]
MELLSGISEFIRENLAIFVLSIMVGIAGGLKLKTISKTSEVCDPSAPECVSYLKNKYEGRGPASEDQPGSGKKAKHKRANRIQRFFRSGIGSHD